MTTREQARAWLDAYLRAWASNEPDDVRAVFAPEGEMRFEPWTEPVVGHDALVESWLGRRDEPGSWRFEGDVLAVDGDLAFIQGVTRYTNGTTYSNLWVVRLADDGRAASFTEWWMDQSHPS
ncbi:MAG: nuclear transport factor 2 family protein [Actinomycetales bacterium]|nr:nuclear transport factor 2 family protein [Actinomycetales bacterium]